MPLQMDELCAFVEICFLFVNLEKIRSIGDDLAIIVGIGGLGIIKGSAGCQRGNGGKE